MKRILEVIKQDWRNIKGTPIVMLLLIGLMILPSLYAWFNLKATWDPYGNTSELAIAVTNEDEGAEVRGEPFNVGEELVDQLADNDKLGWTFVSKEEAERGVIHGDYYASIHIPSDFSEKISSVLTDSPEKPELDYSVNEKINAIAPKMTSAGASTIVEDINENFVQTATEAIFEEFNEIGVQLEQELPTIRNIENQIFELENRLPEISELGDQALRLEEALPEIREQGQKIVDLEKRIPEINEAGDQILELEERFPEIRQAGDRVLELQQRIPEIQQAANAVQEVDRRFDEIATELDTALEQVEKAQDVIGRAQAALPIVEDVADQGLDYVNRFQSFLDENDEAFAAITPAIEQNLRLVEQTTSAAAQLTGALRDAEPSEEAIQNAANLNDRLTSAISMLDQTISLYQELEEFLPGNPLADQIGQLQSLRTELVSTQESVQRVQSALENGEQPAEDVLNELDKRANAANERSSAARSRFESGGADTINSALGQIRETAQTASDNLTEATEMLPNVEGILDDAAGIADYGQEELLQIREAMPEIGTRVHEVAEAINKDLPGAIDVINKASDFVQNDLGHVEDQIHRAADFVRNDLPGAEDQIRKLSDLVQNRLPEAEESVHKIADVVRNQLPDMEDAVKDAADRIRNFDEDYDLGEIIELLKNDVQAESEFFADPVILNEDRKFPIPNYGSASSPFYTSLALWVGALLLANLLRADVEDPENRFNFVHVYFGRLVTFLVVGVGQGLIVTLGNIFILGAYVDNKILYVLFGILISQVFMTMVYTLVSVFGNIGKAIGIILMVLQLSGGGGTFPIQVAPSFFQAIHPFLPFTYAVGLLREAVGGVVPSIVWTNLGFLFLFWIGAIAFGLILKKPLHKRIQATAEKSKASGMIQ